MEKNLRPFVAELVGTFALVFVSAGAVCMNHLYFGPGQPQAYLIGIALAQGAILAAALAATVNVSAGYLNPAITLMLWVLKRTEGQRACWLVGAQLLGGFLAGLVLRLMFSAETVLMPARFGTPHLNLEFFGPASFPADLISGVGIEFVLTFLLTFTIYGTLLDPRAPQGGVLGPGLALTALVLLGYPLTGAATNPARWLGPALWEVTLQKDAFRDHAVYWIGPIFGALAAGLLYEYLILPVGESKARAAVSPEAGPATSTLSKSKK